jgi:FixJ family two-component response regulator
MTQKKHAPAVSAGDRQTVYIIDDDASVRNALERLLISAGIRSRTFADANEFLKAGTPSAGSCVISDVKMHGMTGPELQRKVRESGAHVSFIFVTAYDTEEVRAQAKKDGAVAYFRKPVDDQALLDAIGWAMSHAEENA